MALNDSNKNSISFKKIVGKAHTQQTFAFNEESISSNISMSYATVFGQPIDPNPITNGLTIPYTNDGIVERVKFELEVIPDTQIGLNQSQGYRIKLPASYTGLGALGSIYSGGTILYNLLGKLQIVPSLYGKLKPDGSTEFDPILYQTDGSTIITKFDPIDWILDPYAGVIFVQSPPTSYDTSSARPAYLEAFLYIGKYLDDVISGSNATVSGPNFSVQWRNGVAFSGTGYFEFVPSARTVTLGTRLASPYGLYSLSVGSGHTVNGNNAAAFGAGNISNGLNSFAINADTSATGVQSFAGGFGTPTRKISSAGAASFNFSTNTGSQVSGHGANANQSAILGGQNNNISSLNIGSVIIGGNGVKLSDSGYTYTTAVQNFALFGSLTGGTTGDTFLVIDTVSKKVRGRTASDVIGSIGQAKGPLFSIQYNKSGGFSGQTEFYISETQRALTLGSRDGSIGINSFVIGGNSTASGTYSVAIGDNTTSSGKASIAAGTNSSVSGENSIVFGESNTLGGNRSIVSGYDNTDLANDSAIIGGSGNTVSSGNTGVVLLGVNDLTISGSAYTNTAIINELAIFGSLITGTSGDTVLVLDAVTKKVKQVTQSSIGSSSGGSNLYTGASPSTVTVGGLNSGSVLTGKTTSQILESILVPTLNPTLTAPSITSFTQNLSTLQEVGVSVTPTFTTNFSRGSISPAYGTSGFRSGTPTKYVYTGSGNVRTVTSTSVSNVSSATGATTLVVGANTWSVYVAYSAGEQPKNSSGGNFSTPLASGATAVSNTTINAIYPYFYGKVASGGAPAGSNRPTATNALVTGGTKVVAASTGTVSITFASTSDDYLWFAIPATSTSKTVWYVNALNNGTIGGSVSPGGNLFPAFDSVNVTTVLWSGIPYKVYISNFQTATTGAMEMRNS